MSSKISKRVKLGERLSRSPYADVVARWILQEPSISNSEISSRLKKQYNYEISIPTVGYWRINYFPNIIEKLRPHGEEIIVNKADYFDAWANLEAQLKEVRERKLAVKGKQEEAIEIRDFVQLESLYSEYLDMESKILLQMVKLMGNDYVRAMYSRIIQECSSLAIRELISPLALNDGSSSVPEIDKRKVEIFLKNIEDIYNRYTREISNY